MTSRLQAFNHHLKSSSATGDMASHQNNNPPKVDAESTIKRNPHGDFAKVQASRPDWDESRSWHYTKTRNPDWKYGSGATVKSDLPHVSIDPNAEGRKSAQNYKLLISGIIPRPIGFLSTRAKDGTSTNLAPFSYTQVFSHDPPTFGVGFAGTQEYSKDTLKNLIETGECVINLISEDFIEAANACAIDVPYGTSEWAVSGLTPADCEVVRCSRVKESVFSIEGKLLNTQNFESRNPETPGKVTGALAVIEGVRFWVREDAINEDRSQIDPAVLRPVARLGGITYGRIVDGFEIPRAVLSQEKEKGKIGDDLFQAKVQGQ
jgi:flavin reductase (DIM6/NTAB) family NADH-FMN oxidoreductase RutF